MQDWAASETSRLLRQELGVEATFKVETSIIPLRLAVTDLRVPSTDGGSPAVAARLIAVSPRLFSLLAGRIDVGDIELEDSAVRLVLRENKLMNLALRLPESKDETAPDLKRAPFRTLAITNARLDLDIDGARIKTDSIDVDAFAERNLNFDVALRASGAELWSERKGSQDGALPSASDEDRLCALDLRVHLSKEEILIRRLSLLGIVDQDPKKDTRPTCDPEAESRLAVRLSQLKLRQVTTSPQIRGHVMVRAPLVLIDRIAAGSHAEGWVGLSGDVNYDSRQRLPEFNGEVTGDHMRIDGYGIAEHLRAEVLVTGEKIQVPVLDAGWGNGDAHVTGLTVEPFKEHIPISVDKIVSKDIDFPGTMRDVDVTKHSWADWNFGDAVVSKVRGTAAPFYLDGGITAETRDFVMWDRGFDDPARKRMIGIKQAKVDGRWRAHSKAVEFYNTEISFGQSRLPVELIRIGLFSTGITVRLKEGGGKLDFADVSPIADVELKGQSDVYVNLDGPNAHPVLDGTVAVRGLSVGGFPAGNIESALVHFEPLFVEFSELSGNKGAMDYTVPKARLSFDGPASVEFTANVSSDNFLTSEFFQVFHFDEDPRFDGISAQGKVSANVRYLLGGPEDVCPGGLLKVSGSTTVGKSELFGETFSDGNAEFDFEWFDIDAGTSGMRVDVPALSLRKGSGAVLGSVKLHPEGILTGDLIGTQIPISRIDALGGLMAQTDGFVTGSGTLSGSVDAMALSATVDVTELKTGDQEVPPSHLTVRLDPAPVKPVSPSAKKTECQRPIPPDFSPEEYARDESTGTFVVNGRLFGGQIELEELTLTAQNNAVLAGTANLKQLDFGALGAFVGADLLDLPRGSVSGSLKAKRIPLSDLYASDAELTVTEFSATQGALRAELLDRRATLTIKERKVSSEHLALRATTGEGQEGILDCDVKIDERKRINASLDLRPTDLSIFAGALPGIERAKGPITASFGLTGPVSDPQFSGFFEIENGTVSLSGLRSPLSEIFLTVSVDDTGLHVKEGRAVWGDGSVTVRGEAPLISGSLGRTDLTLAARQVALRLDEHVRVAFDADLLLTVPPPASESLELPSLSGDLNVLSADYEKPMSVTADISTLAKRGEKTTVDAYDAEKDNLKVDVLVRSSKPLRVENDLVSATLSVDPAGLRLTGTDQRLGAVGSVEVDQGGRVFLRSHQFEVQRGLVRFTDPTRMRPEVDVKAITEYRRYEDRGATQGDTQANADTSSGATTAGTWRIMLHAYGPPEDLKVDMSSDPHLAQDDIFLLLTVGLTRTELDQTQNSGVGSSVALEALGKLSGAESAVTDTVPVDEFRFGSSYSSRSGRTEPTVTIGKRLSRRMRASVTTSVSESSEVRSNVEYRATDNLSVEGSWDNARNVSSATGGNLGGDVRWRVEFQ